MASTNPEREKLRERAAAIAQWNFEALIHPEKAGPFNFESDRLLLESVIGFYKDVASANFNLAPANLLDPLIRVSETVSNALVQVQSFNYREGDPNQNSRNLISNLNSAWRDAYGQTAPHLAFALISSGAMAQNVESLKITAATIRTEWKTASEAFSANTKTSEEQLKTRIAEFERVMEAAREASAIKAVSAQASEFDSEAKNCLRASYWWFGSTILVVTISLLVVWFMFLKGPGTSRENLPSAAIPFSVVSTNQPSSSLGKASSSESATEAKAITAGLLQQTVARLLIVTLLYSAVIWCARNYFACRHNFTVNRHRRNAMQTFRAFVEGTEDKPTRDFILRQAATCAFTPQQSGYLKDESLPTPGPASQIVDILKPEAK